MAAPTALEITASRNEYSRYEEGRSIIDAHLIAVGGAPYSGETVLVQLVKARRNRDAAVSTEAVTLTGTDPFQANVTFDLRNIVDQDLVNLVRHGMYFLKATYPGTPASTVLGSGTNGQITVSSVAVGTIWNSYSIELVAPSGTSELSATRLGNAITVNLAVSSGVPVAAKNAALTVATVIGQQVPGFVASWSGNGGDPMLPAGPVLLTGGTDIVTAESPDFKVSIITVDRMKSDYLFGLPLTATDLRGVKFQPSAITGIEIIEVSRGHSPGFMELTYNYTVTPGGPVRTLAWNGGPAVSITAPGTYVLRGGVSGLPGCGPFSGASNDYIVVRVTSLLLLPTTSVTETIIIENKELDDETLARYIDESVAYVENSLLEIYVEPTRVTSVIDPTVIQYAAGLINPNPIYVDTDWDFVRQPLTYYPRFHNWVQVQTPFNRIIRVDNLFGAIGNTRVIDISLDWIEVAHAGGLIQLVPFNQEIAFNYLGILWVNAIRGAAELPNFWNYDLIAGLRDCPADIRDIIGKRAAMNALIMLALAFRPGVGSNSLSRDGVSQSVSYLSGSKYGPYTGAIQGLMDTLKELEPKIKRRWAGGTWAVV